MGCSAKSESHPLGGWQTLGCIMWTQGGREEVQVPSRISPPAQPGWVALAFCSGSVSIGWSRRLAGLVEEPGLGVVDDIHGATLESRGSRNWADGEDHSEQGKTFWTKSPEGT